MTVIVPHVRQLLSRQLGYLFEGEEEVLCGADGDLDDRVRQKTQVPRPYSRAVDKVFALDRPLTRLDRLDPNSVMAAAIGAIGCGRRQVIGRVRDDSLHSAVPDEPGAAGVRKEGERFRDFLWVHGGIFGNPNAALNVLRVKVRMQLLDFRWRQHMAIETRRLVAVRPPF